MRPAAAALSLLLLASPPPARAVLDDVGLVTMGRTTFPEDSWVVDSFMDQTVARWSAPAAPTLNHNFLLMHGVHDRVTVGVVASAAEAQRRPVRFDRAGGLLGAQVLARPFQAAPLLVVFPRGRDGRAEFVVGLELLKNVGNWSLQLGYLDEFRRGPGELAYNGDHHLVEPGVFYRFGLRGVLGAHYLLQTVPAYESTSATPLGAVTAARPASRVHMWGPVLGGGIGRGLFLALKQRFGLNRDAPESVSTVQVQYYFGPYALGSWGL